jgi:hypothetical protein
LRCPFDCKELLELKTSVLCLQVRPKHIDGFAVAMLKSDTDSILLTILAGWNY